MLLAVFLIAVASFIWPLWEMHNLLVREKARQEAELSQRVAGAIAEIKKRMDAGELAGMEQMKNSMESLTLAQGVLDKVPTWPWQAETIRAVVTALLLPVVLWLIQRALDRFLLP
jgi:predicted PurR-regulated permease PerM